MAEFDLLLSFLLVRPSRGISVLCSDHTVLGKNIFSNHAIEYLLTVIVAFLR